MNGRQKIFVSAGEASGDLHGGELMQAMLALNPQTEFVFLGGDHMARAAGKQPFIHYRDMAFMGFIEVVAHAGKLLGNLKRAKKAISDLRPDAVVLIDYPSFNLKLAKHAHKLGIPVYYYISPKVWAWKEWRVKDMKRYCTKVLSILPFEVEYFRGKNMEVAYVGNPSAEEVDARMAGIPSRDEFLTTHSLADDKPILALVPGSRVAEIKSNLPIFCEVARRFPQFQPVIAAAPSIDRSLYSHYSNFPMVENATFELMRYASAALVTSGTATLECALLGTPQVVCYRSVGSKVAYNLLKCAIKCPFVSLPNLIAGKALVPEMLMHLCTPDAVAAELEKILPDTPGRSAQIEGYAMMRRRLGSAHAAPTAARLILASV